MSAPVEAAETIAAIATPAGRGAVGIVRVSGPAAARIATELVGVLPPPRVAALRTFRDADGSALDSGLAVYFPPPASFTGEAVVELQGHGGAVVLDRLLTRALALGARLARPGEFSERAFLNGKLDLAQAEAVADLIDAATTEAARAAVRSLQGEFSARVRQLQTGLTELRVRVEAGIDFPDEDIDLPSGAAVQERTRGLFDAFDALIAATRQGTVLKDGLHVVIAGRPNAGKSSLLNRLAGEELAIVTPQPGTTRDVLRHAIHLDGLVLSLSDTAGLRSATDGIEAEGIRRARAEMAKADHILYVLDASLATRAEADELEALPAGVPLTWVLNKIDLQDGQPRIESGAASPQVFLSAHTGAGVDMLRAHLKAVAGLQAPGSGSFSARRRHLDALRRARGLFEQAAVALGDAPAVELFAEDLRLAQQALGEITGAVSSEDLLGEIFSSFCIGK